MISQLRGKLASKKIGDIVIDVNGVGYGVRVSLSTFYELSDIDSEVSLLIYTSVKQDSIELFGFITEIEKTMFELLIGITGIGPKAAVNILSRITPEELIRSISTGDIKDKKIPGVGPKISSRLVTELRDKLPDIRAKSADDKLPSDVRRSVVSALINLGYKKSEIEKNMSKIEDVISKHRELEDVLKQTLVVMGGS